MKVLSILQPSFLPYLGYIDLIKKVTILFFMIMFSLIKIVGEIEININ